MHSTFRESKVLIKHSDWAKRLFSKKAKTYPDCRQYCHWNTEKTSILVNHFHFMISPISRVKSQDFLDVDLAYNPPHLEEDLKLRLLLSAGNNGTRWLVGLIIYLPAAMTG
jgi:hypothetical protein